MAEHVNDDLDVLLVVLAGAGRAIVDDTPHALRGGSAILLPRGARRRIVAGAGGLRYVSVHRRRGPLRSQGPHTAAL